MITNYTAIATGPPLDSGLPFGHSSSPVLNHTAHASWKSKNSYFRILRKGSDVFFGADSESPHMTYGKNASATLRSYRRKIAFNFIEVRGQCAANWCTNFNCKLLVRVPVRVWGWVRGLWLSSGHLLLSIQGMGLGSLLSHSIEGIIEDALRATGHA